MKLFFDTNIILDLILKRELFFEEAAKILSYSELNDNVQLYVSSLSIVNANYVACKFTSKAKVIESLKMLRLAFDVIDVSVKEIDSALYSNFNDFEDAVQYFSALKKNCNYIITRDSKDFKNSKIMVLSPSAFLKMIKQP